MKKVLPSILVCLLSFIVFTSCDQDQVGVHTITLDSGILQKGAETIDTVEEKGVILPSGGDLWQTDEYTFSGWATASGGDAKYGAGEKYSPSSNATLYAVWSTNATITYKANGGTGEEITEYYKKGDKVTLKNTSFTKEGHTLSCWSTSTSGGDSYTIGQEITLAENLTLYAIWVENKDAVSIIFSSGKVTENEQSMSSTEGQEIILPSGDSFWSSNEYSFTGWAVSENGDVQYNAGDKYKVGKGGATLYAVWEDNLTITYKANGGTGSDVIEYYKSGSKVIVKDASFTKEDYSFSYWSTTESGTDGTSYTLGEEISITTNMTLYAIWVETKDAVKLIFNPGTGVTGEELEMNLIEGQTTFLPSGSRFWEADNYTFKGWGDKIGWGVGYSAGDLYYAEKNTTLYAVWEKNKVTVTYSANGGSGSVDAGSVEVGTTVNLNNGASITREGFALTSWNTSSNGTGITYDLGASMKVDSDIVLYAVWKENRNIKYYNGDKLIGIEYPTTENVAIGDGNGLSKDGHALYWTTSSDGSGTSYDVGEEYTGTDSLVLYAQWQEDNGSLTYTLDTTSKTYSVKASNTGISGEIEIPETYKGKKVTAIEELGFAECKNVTKITIPSSVTSIGGGAFYYCYSLETVNIPDGITELKPSEGINIYYEKGLFEKCVALKNIVIPRGVTIVGNKTFDSCGALPSTFKIPNSVTSIGEYAFFNSGIQGELALPEGLKSIGTEAFLYCYDLTKVTIPSSVTAIGEYAFSSCSSLTISISNITLESGSWNSILADYMGSGSYSVIIEDGVTTIGTQFQNCNTVTSISVPSSVTSIDSSAFSGCSKLASIYVDNYRGTDTAPEGSPWGAPSTDCTVTWKGITEPGDTITLGIKGGTGIVWKALKVEANNNRALLISRDVLEKRNFESSSGSYGSSKIREYLNNTSNDGFFKKYGLSTDYIKKVDVTTAIETTTVSNEGSDYVFLLSKTETESYFANATKIAHFEGLASSWWLRSYNDITRVYNVRSGGYIVDDYYDIDSGIRPAFWYTWN